MWQFLKLLNPNILRNIWNNKDNKIMEFLSKLPQYLHDIILFLQLFQYQDQM